MSRWIVIWVVTIFGETAAAKELRIVPRDGETFAAAEIVLIEKAARLVMERMGGIAVTKCSYRNAWRGEPDEDYWGRAMGVFRRQSVLTIEVSRSQMARKMTAKATVSAGKIDERHDTWRKLAITFNEKRLAKSSHAKEGTEKFWAATIAHELAHNMGLRHGSRGDWEDSYAGYFVTELGYCVMTNGLHGSDMGDVDLRRKREKRFDIKW